jgi:hypothetical protein
MLFFVLLAFFKGYVILAMRLPLFAISGIIGLIVGLYFFIKSHKGLTFREIIAPVPLLIRTGIAILITVVVTAPFAFASYGIYRGTDKHFSTMYSADYIQALPDGTAPSLYKKRKQKGGVLAQLSVGERVTVNGIAMNYKDYNITTESGITGWVQREAFPEDAAEMLGIAMELGGFDQEQIQTDRYTERLMEKYLNKTPRRKSTNGEVLTWNYEIDNDKLKNFTRVNIETPLLRLNSKDYKNGGTFQDTGDKITFAGILYAEDCTLIHLTTTASYAHGRAGKNTNEWWNNLTVTDLNTGEKWKMLRTEDIKTESTETLLGGKNGKEYLGTLRHAVFVFPPFKSRNFSLTHEADPMPSVDKIKENYGGLLGLAYNILTHDALDFSGAVNYHDWNFKEVRVR